MMERVGHFLIQNWLAVSLLVLGLAAALATAILRRRAGWPWTLGIIAFVVLPLALGGLIPTAQFQLPILDIPSTWPALAILTALVVLATAFFVLIVTGAWSAHLAFGMALLLLFGLGGLVVFSLGEWLSEAAGILVRMEPTHPWWLLLLGFLPVVVWMSYRSLAGLGPVRRWLAIGLRCTLLVLLTLALAEIRLRHTNERLTVIFLLDRSLSVPQDVERGSTGNLLDLRFERIKKFINDAVKQRGPDYLKDAAGLIVFGRRPHLELPPSVVPDLKFDEVQSIVDPTYTDIAAAIKLALASFPEGTAKRLVLISDGNENLGNAQEQAQLAKNNGVQIDVLPLAVGYRNESEILVERIEAPPITDQGTYLPIRVLLRSYHPGLVKGTLSVTQIAEKDKIPIEGSPMTVLVRPGLNAYGFKHQLPKEKKSYSFEARFTPEEVVDEQGRTIAEGVPNDRVQNNSATTHVVAMGQRRILLIETRKGDHQLLLDRLRDVDKDSKFKVHAVVPKDLPEDAADLAVFLSNYDCVILANLPADDFSEEQMEIIRRNTMDQGCGLVMIGGPESFGAGGWQGTPVEKALPVDCEIKSMKVEGKGGLVLYMHASEIADGNRWQKEVGKLAVRKLSPMDMVGVMYYGMSGHTWFVKFQEIAEKRDLILRRIEQMNPGDMPDVDPALEMVLKELTNPKHELTTKHMIFISDGDHWTASNQLLGKFRANNITISTVCITSHGALEEKKMADMAQRTRGRSYCVKSPKALPEIYQKEARIVSQSYVYQKPFQPIVQMRSGPTEGLPDPVNKLYGYVRTTPKVSPAVRQEIVTDHSVGGTRFPILATWQYGLGRAVAFTSDATSRSEAPGDDEEKRRCPAWDRAWAESAYYTKFWEQVIGWALRSVESGKLVMTTEYRDGMVFVTVDARDENNKPLTDLRLRGRFTPPPGTKIDDPNQVELQFEQTNAGVYQAKFKADQAGSYFVNAMAERMINKDGKEELVTDSVRGGITVPYSPEFADLESNVALMERIREITAGRTLSEDSESLTKAAMNSDVFRRGDLPKSRSFQNVWYWLLFLTGMLLLLDVANRRIAIDPNEVIGVGRRVWGRLRGQATTAETPQFLERLKSRKAQVEESLEKARAARRFEGTAETEAPPAGADVEAQASGPAPMRAPPPPQVSPDKPQEAQDYASRLMKAKKKVWEERKDKPE